MRTLTVMFFLMVSFFNCQAQTVLAWPYSEISTYATAVTDEYIWSAIYGGLTRVSVDGEEKLFTSVNSGLPSDYISCLAHGSGVLLWVGTDRGLVLWEAGTWTVYTKSNSGLLSDNVTCLKFDGDGILWVGSDAGINSYKDGNWTSIKTDAEVQALEHDDATGILWAGLAGGRICKLSGKVLDQVHRIPRYESYPGFFEDNYVNDLKLDNQGRLWAALASGLECFASGGWKHFSAKDLKQTYQPQAIGVDRSGVVWVGGIGLSYFDGKQWINVTESLDGNLTGMVQNIEALRRELRPFLLVSTSEFAEITGGSCLVGVDFEDDYESAEWAIRNNIFPDLGIADRFWEHIDDLQQEDWWDVNLYGDPVKLIVATSLLGSPLGADKKIWYDVVNDVFHGEGIELVPQPVPDLSLYTEADPDSGDPGQSDYQAFMGALYNEDGRTCDLLVARGFDVNAYSMELSDYLLERVEHFFPGGLSYFEMSDAEIARDKRSLAHSLASSLTRLKRYGLKLPDKKKLLSAAVNGDLPDLAIEAIRQY